MKKLELHEWWPEMVSLKDELSLRQLGERFGVSAGAVANAFKRTGIERKPAPPGPRKNRQKGFSGRASKIDPFADEVGQVSDRVVAEKAGVSVAAVGAWRRRRGIPAARDTEGQPTAPAVATATRPTASPAAAPTPTANPPATRLSSRAPVLAWRVTVGGDTRVVLATSMVEAAIQAERAGDTTSVELVGVLLHAHD